jgi:hypothetical protein
LLDDLALPKKELFEPFKNGAASGGPRENLKR